MKVYTLTSVSFDYHRFDEVVAVGCDLEKLIAERAHQELPVYSHEQDLEDFCDWGNEDGQCGYVWKEWEV